MMSDDLRQLLARARGAAATAKVLPLDAIANGQGEGSAAPMSLGALRGRFVELSARGASATLTAAFDLVAEAQREGEPVAWITDAQSSFYPPDVAESGIDLAALVIVRVQSIDGAPRSAERLLRSGAFGLVVLDLAGSEAVMPHHQQGRLVTLAQAHDAAVVCLTEKPEDAASIGSLISLRAEALRIGKVGTGEPFEVATRVLKDKRRGPGFVRALKARGPAGG